MSSNPDSAIRHQFEPADLAHPLGWINRQPYAQLKSWLRTALWQRVPLPVVVPHNAVLGSYLAELLLRCEARVGVELRTIVPELIVEWRRADDRRTLDDLLVLAGNLNCNEAETPIARVVTDKLTKSDEDAELRLRALGVLQTISTDRSLHVFARYVGELKYAAVCYRSLYQLNLSYAVSELPGLIGLYESKGQMARLTDVLKVLFKYTLTRREYLFVLRPLVEQTAPQHFIRVLQTLRDISVLDKKYFAEGSATQLADLLRQMMRRAPVEDYELIWELVVSFGIKIGPPIIPFHLPVDEEARDRAGAVRAGAATPVPVYAAPDAGGQYFTIPDRWGAPSEQVPVIDADELGEYRSWGLCRNIDPRELEFSPLLDPADN